MRLTWYTIAVSSALAILVSLNAVSSFDITVTKGGYEGVIVAIHRSVPEDENIITNIKNMFNSGSGYLFSATGQRLYFKDVTIVIPESWSGEYGQKSVFSDYFSESHVRIAPANPEFGDAPYTLQPGECGEQGEYVHFTPRFVLNENGFALEMFGEPGKQLVHEWAHFRYGVFDEYGSAGDRRFPRFYLDNGKILPSSCVQDVKGWIEKEDGKPCDLYANNFVGDDCLFIPNMEDDGQTLKASIMYMPFLPTIFSFCEDKTPDMAKKHNWRAPTKQNAFCKYKSTWEIITKHPDLIKSTEKLANDTKTEPIFNILKFVGNDERKVVLVMDVSPSMNTLPSQNSRIRRLNSAAKRFILDTLPHNVSLGMIDFHGTAIKLTTTLVRLSNYTVREELSKLVPSMGYGSGTSIGAGLNAALEILKQNGGNTEGATIILITDGEENTSPHISKYEKDLENAKVIVNTVAMGGTAEKLLESLATKTGGRSFYFPDNSQDASGLDSAFVASTSSQVDVEFRPITLVGEALTIVNETVEEVVIDKELGKNTEFSFRGADLKRVELSLKSPDGLSYNEQSPQFNDGVDFMQRKKFFFEAAKPGKWLVMYKVTGNAPISVTFNLASEVIDAQVQPVRVQSWFDKTEVTFPASVKVLSRVTKGYNVVLNATVNAVVVRPNEKDYELVLRDNGAGADAIKDDGIYSAYFRAFSGNGRYAAVATVINNGEAQVKIPGRNYARFGSGAPGIPKNRTNTDQPALSEFDLSEFRAIEAPIPEPKFETEPAEEFSRNVDLGNFQLKQYNPNSQVGVEPDRVTDLKVQYIGPPNSVEAWELVSNYSNETNGSAIVVELRWIAVANGIDGESVSGLEIRGSITGEEMITDFKNGYIVHTETGKLPPPGEEQRAVFVLPPKMDETGITKNSTDIYFALVSLNARAQRSDMSNIATAHLGYTAPTWMDETTTILVYSTDMTVVESTTQEPIATDTSDSSGNQTGLIVGITIGVVLFIGLLGFVVYKFICKK